MIPRLSRPLREKGRVLFLLVGAALLAAAAAAQTQDYVVGPKDLLEIRVFNEPDLDRTLEIASDGTISFPLISSVKVAGLAVREVEHRLEQLLAADYLVKPHVSVLIKEYNSQKVYVLGAVKDPGYYDLRGPTTVLEILSRAGGLAPEGGKTLVLVRPERNPEAEPAPPPEKEPDPGRIPAPLNHADRTLIIDYYRMVKEGDTTQNVVLETGDILFVPRAREIFVLGEVKKPGSVTYEEGISLLKAISLAGGLSELAAARRVQVIRIRDGAKENLTVNLNDVIGDINKDIRLLPDDVIVVPKSIL